MTHAITGLYPDIGAADVAVARLIADGIRRGDISVILASTPGHEKIVLDETDDTQRGAIVGAVGGGVLASLAFATLALSGIGILAAGPVAAALSAGSVGAMGGGVLGALIGHGTSTMTAQEYETELQKGRALVAVHSAHDQIKRVRQLLTSTGATHVSDAVHFHRERPRGDAESAG